MLSINGMDEDPLVIKLNPKNSKHTPFQKSNSSNINYIKAAKID